jgi:hypothetical protein
MTTDARLDWVREMCTGYLNLHSSVLYFLFSLESLIEAPLIAFELLVPSARDRYKEVYSHGLPYVMDGL